MAKFRGGIPGGMGMGNMNNMIKQAQKMQEQMLKIQEEAEGQSDRRPERRNEERGEGRQNRRFDRKNDNRGDDNYDRVSRWRTTAAVVSELVSPLGPIHPTREA